MMNTFKEKMAEYRRYDGRITRGTYIERVIGRWITAIAAIIFIYLLAFLISVIGSRWAADEVMFLTAIVVLPTALLINLSLLFFKIFQEVRRLHDMNASGWWAILGFIPAINIVYYIFLIFNDGTYGPNKYGEDPKGREQ